MLLISNLRFSTFHFRMGGGGKQFFLSEFVRDLKPWRDLFSWLRDTSLPCWTLYSLSFFLWQKLYRNFSVVFVQPPPQKNNISIAQVALFR